MHKLKSSILSSRCRIGDFLIQTFQHHSEPHKNVIKVTVLSRLTNVQHNWFQMKTSNFPRQKLNKGFAEGNLGNEKIATNAATTWFASKWDKEVTFEPLMSFLCFASSRNFYLWVVWRPAMNLWAILSSRNRFWLVTTWDNWILFSFEIWSCQ